MSTGKKKGLGRGLSALFGDVSAQDKKATEYEKRSGTSKEDGYFR